MNIIAKCGCRVFQTIFKLAIPILPYRSPQVLTHIEEIPNVLKEQNITSVLVVTDGFLHLSGMLEPLKKALSESKISYTIYDEVVPNPTILNVEMARERYIENHCQGLIGFGGGSAIDCAIHLATSNMGFGGVGESGMGSYHGKTGFDTFTHYKSIVDKKTWLDLPMRYQPYHKLNDWLIHMFLK